MADLEVLVQDHLRQRGTSALDASPTWDGLLVVEALTQTEGLPLTVAISCTPVATATITFTVATVDGTAENGTDYVAVGPLTLTIEAGASAPATSATYPVQITTMPRPGTQGSRKLTVRVSDIVAGGVGTTQGTVDGEQTIVDTTASPLERNLHPRIFVNVDLLPGIRTRVTTGGVWATEAETWVTGMDTNYPTATYTASTYWWIGYAWLAHLTRPDDDALGTTRSLPGLTPAYSWDQYRDKALALVRAWMAWVDADRGSRFSAGALGHQASVLAYDWLHEWLTGAERTWLITFLQTIDAQGTSYITDNPLNDIVCGGRRHRVMAALAMAGETALNESGVAGDTWAQLYLTGDNSFSGLFRGPHGVTSVWSFFSAGDGTCAAEGLSYLLNYSLPKLYSAEEAYRTAYGISKAAHYADAETDALHYFPKLFSYMDRAWGRVESGFTGGRRYMPWKTNTMYPDLAWGSLTTGAELCLYAGMTEDVSPTMAQLAQWWIDNRVRSVEGSIYRNIEARCMYGPMVFMVGNKWTALSPSAAGISTAKRLGEYGYAFLRRGTWALTDTLVQVGLSKWTRGKGWSRDIGGFTLDRQGCLIVNNGMEAHSTGYNSHGCNMLVFVDPDQTPTLPTALADTTTYSLRDQGGARFGAPDWPAAGTAGYVEDSSYDTLGEVREAYATATRDCHYVMGDLTRGYNSTLVRDAYPTENPVKVSHVVRHVVWFPAATETANERLVLFDRATTVDTKYEKRWLLHTSPDPVVHGTEIAGLVPERYPGDGHGHWHATDATHVSATHTPSSANGYMQGVVYWTPILPASRTINRIGGPNRAGNSWRYYSTTPADMSHEEEDMWGVMITTKPPTSDFFKYYNSRYHLECIPATPALTDVFLNVIEAGDYTAARTVPDAWAGTGWTGVAVGDRAAVFATADDATTSGSFVITTAGLYRVVIAGLGGSTRTVTGGDQIVTVDGGTTSPFTVTAGQVYLEIDTRSTGPGATITIS